MHATQAIFSTGSSVRSVSTRISAFIAAALLAGPPTLAAVFSNSDSITINEQGPASPYPSEITVSGLGHELTSITVTLHDYFHTSNPEVQIALQSPSGTSVMLAGYGSGLTDSPVTITFDDNASQSIPYFYVEEYQYLSSGSYRPASHGLDEPFTAGPTSLQASLSAFTGENPNGTWKLYVEDFYARDFGTISGGWSLNVTAVPEPAHYVGAVALGLAGWAGHRRWSRSARG
jgi:hypothetical protein